MTHTNAVGSRAFDTATRKIGGDIKLARVGRRPNEVLQITKLVTLFEIFDKVENAVASFKRAALQFSHLRQELRLAPPLGFAQSHRGSARR
jgi:hypothetical protein